MGVVQLGNNKNDASGNTGTGANAAVVAKVVLVKLARNQVLLNASSVRWLRQGFLHDDHIWQAFT